MAGHSHFANIKHKKAANDAKKAKLLGKISKEIQVALKEGSNNPEQNSKLRLALEKARANNIPKDNIDRILNKDSKDAKQLFEINYEGYGPGGTAIFIECLSDNVNRISAEVRSTLSKHGGNLGVSGSVGYLFDVLGVLVIDDSLISFQKAEELSIEADAIDILKEEGIIIIKTDRKHLVSTKELFEKNGVKEFLKSEITRIPNQEVSISKDKQEQLEKLIDALEDLDDVKDVYTNATI